MCLVVRLLAATCAHIANLLLARGIDRQAEMAIRSALGAGRRRIARQLLVESMMLSLLGGTCSVLVALASIRLLCLTLGHRTPYLAELSLDHTTLALTFGLSVATSLIFGLLPAVRASRYGCSSRRYMK